jgi:serine/threonine-protein kinase
MTPRKLLLVLMTVLVLGLAAPAAANAAYGAIAVNVRTNATGVGYGYATKDRAQQRAEKECQGKCRKALWVRNHCGALAVNKRGRYFAEFGKSAHKAKNRARHHGRLLAWVCSG